MDLLPFDEYARSLDRKRLSAGVLFRDRAGRVLLVQPSYKPYWDIPGGAVDEGEAPWTAAVREIHEEIGLDRPLAVQYLDWLGGAARGDLGSSIATSGTGGLSYRPVAQTVGKGLLVTAWLSGLGILLATVAGLALGLLGATRRRGGTDAALSGVALLGLSLPDFYLGFLLILLFTVTLGWLPSVGFVEPVSHVVG